MHIGHLHLATVVSVIFDCHGLTTACIGVLIDLHDLSVVLRSQQRLVVTTDVNTLVELCLSCIDGVGTVPEGGGDKHELLSFQRKGIETIRSLGSGCLLTVLGRNGQRIVGNTELLSLGCHLLHDHSVVLLEVGTFDDIANGGDIVLVSGVAASLDAFSPSFIVIRGEVLGVFLISGSHEDLGMILIALSDIIILLELFVGLVVIGKHIGTIELTLHAKVVVGSPGEGALSTC